MKRAFVISLLLCGCSHTHTRVDVGAASAQGSVKLHIDGGRTLATVLGLSILAGAIYQTARAGYPDARSVPELDPSRKVSEQDCTKPLDYSLGNIRCK